MPVPASKGWYNSSVLAPPGLNLPTRLQSPLLSKAAHHIFCHHTFYPVIQTSLDPGSRRAMDRLTLPSSSNVSNVTFPLSFIGGWKFCRWINELLGQQKVKLKSVISVPIQPFFVGKPCFRAHLPFRCIKKSASMKMVNMAPSFMKKHNNEFHKTVTKVIVDGAPFRNRIYWASWTSLVI